LGTQVNHIVDGLLPEFLFSCLSAFSHGIGLAICALREMADASRHDMAASRKAVVLSLVGAEYVRDQTHGTRFSAIISRMAYAAYAPFLKVIDRLCLRRYTGYRKCKRGD
jgi:hypothetical protein